MDAEAALSEVESFESTPAPPPRSLKIVYPEDERNGDNMREGSPPRANDLIEATHAMLLAQTSFTKTSEESARSLAKAMEIVLQQQVQPKGENGNGATNRRVTWLMAIFAMVTLLGTGANFLTSSGFAVGGKAGELGQTQKDVARIEAQAERDKLRLQTETDKLETRLREYEVWLQTTREKLADRGWKLPPLPKGQE